jgi:hypothetical protein
VRIIEKLGRGLALGVLDRHRLSAAIEAMWSFLPKLETNSTPILIIDRATTDDFHSSSMSETEMSGAQRRSTPNLRDVCEEILVQGSFVFADMAIMRRNYKFPLLNIL